MSYLVLLGTNRDKPLSGIIATQINLLLDQKGLKYKFLSLGDLDAQNYGPEMYLKEKRSTELTKLQEETMIPAKKWIIIMPEYNGSMPGVLKAFIDLMSLKKVKETFHFKKVLLIGVAAGRAGNLRGMDHLSGILNHMKMNVFPVKQPISKIEDFVDVSDYKITDSGVSDLLSKLIDQFNEY